MPKGKYQFDYQYEANRRAEQRRQALWGDAQNSLRQGLDLFQSYRPGGSAAAASGFYGQKAQLYGTQALNTEAPDLLIDYREQLRQRAEDKIDKLNRITSGQNYLGSIFAGARRWQPTVRTRSFRATSRRRLAARSPAACRAILVPRCSAAVAVSQPQRTQRQRRSAAVRLLRQRR
jgi:hypothetical protein